MSPEAKKDFLTMPPPITNHENNEIDPEKTSDHDHGRKNYVSSLMPKFNIKKKPTALKLAKIREKILTPENPEVNKIQLTENALCLIKATLQKIIIDNKDVLEGVDILEINKQISNLVNALGENDNLKASTCMDWFSKELPPNVFSILIDEVSNLKNFSFKKSLLIKIASYLTSPPKPK